MSERCEHCRGTGYVSDCDRGTRGGWIDDALGEATPVDAPRDETFVAGRDYDWRCDTCGHQYVCEACGDSPAPSAPPLAAAHRGEAEGPSDGWNQFICLECGAGAKADEDGCCTGCGMDCLAIVDGQLVGADTILDVARGEVRDETAEAIAAWLASQAQTYPSGPHRDSILRLARDVQLGSWRPAIGGKEPSDGT